MPKKSTRARAPSLAGFIKTNMDAILGEWDRFAETIPVRPMLDKKTLRDASEEILRAIAEDMSRPQSAEVQEAKSKGKGSGTARRPRRSIMAPRGSRKAFSSCKWSPNIARCGQA